MTMTETRTTDRRPNQPRLPIYLAFNESGQPALSDPGLFAHPAISNILNGFAAGCHSLSAMRHLNLAN